MKKLEVLSNIEMDSRVKLILDHVTKSLGDKAEDEYSKIILTLLAPQLILYFKSLDTITEDNSVSTQDNYKHKAKSPEVQVLQQANTQIITLLDKLCLAPFTKAKVKRLNSNSNEDAEDLLKALLN